MMLRIATPAEVRLAMFLIQILNYMWIEAIFVNRNEMSEDCFAVCPDTTWITRKIGAVLFAFFLSIPAMRIMYVSLAWMVDNRCAGVGPNRLESYGEGVGTHATSYGEGIGTHATCFELEPVRKNICALYFLMQSTFVQVNSAFEQHDRPRWQSLQFFPANFELFV